MTQPNMLQIINEDDPSIPEGIKKAKETAVQVLQKGTDATDEFILIYRNAIDRKVYTVVAAKTESTAGMLASVIDKLGRSVPDFMDRLIEKSMMYAGQSAPTLTTERPDTPAN